MGNILEELVLKSGSGNNMVLCIEPGCMKDSQVRGYCRACYNRNIRNGTIEIILKSSKRPRYGKQKCKDDNCNNTARCRDYCNYHYHKYYTNKRKCV